LTSLLLYRWAAPVSWLIAAVWHATAEPDRAAGWRDRQPAAGG